MIFETIALAKFSYSTGTAGTVTVGAGLYVIAATCHATAANATLTIAPTGPNQGGAAGGAIPIPPATGFDLPWTCLLGQLGPGTVFTFTNTDAFFVAFSNMRAG